MKTTSISDLKARLSAFIDLVRDGDEVIVTDRGRPVARLVAVRGDEQQAGQRELLLRSGRLRPPTTMLAPDFWARRRVLDPEGRSLAALLEERDRDR
jgi:prevent-host-death family protein